MVYTIYGTSFLEIFSNKGIYMRFRLDDFTYIYIYIYIYIIRNIYFQYEVMDKGKSQIKY